MARIGDSLAGRGVLITQVEEFMGAALVEAFTACGAQVTARQGPLAAPEAAAEAVAAAGEVDILIAHLAIPAPRTSADAVEDAEWRRVFAHLVDPLPRLARAVLPAMLAKRRGAIVVMGSSSALRGMPKVSAYAAARGAQLAWMRALGVELAPQGVRVNAIVQNYVESPTYFPPEIRANEKFQARLKREVPLARLGQASESAALAVMLASDEAGFIAGQAVPCDGGWSG